MTSQVFATDVDEATVVSVQVADGGDTSTLTLDAPLKFTHLGVVLSDFPGDDRDTVLDMRAEVCLS